MSLQISYVEVLSPQVLQTMTVFGNRAFKYIMKFKIRSYGWDQIQYDWGPCKKRRLGHRHVQRGDHVRTQGEDSHLQAKEKRPQEKLTP